MKLTLLGAAGVRTPLIVEEIIRRRDKLNVDEVCLMDIDEQHLELIAAITARLEVDSVAKFKISRTISAEKALDGADFVITTFRIGGIDSRIIDERVPLELGYLGQETTGAGGFAMGLRSIPPMLAYVEQMKKLCPTAWLVNFANPSGMITEAIRTVANWQRSVGICDGPSSMIEIISQFLNAPIQSLDIDYFGLNHLGWIRGVKTNGINHLPRLIETLQQIGGLPGYRIDVNLVAALGMLPNEYLYYYYHSKQAIEEILQKSETRGEMIARFNTELFQTLAVKRQEEDYTGLEEVYRDYIKSRSHTYLLQHNQVGENNSQEKSSINTDSTDFGYAKLALDMIEALQGGEPKRLILNLPNDGSIDLMDASDIVEIPAQVSQDSITPLHVGPIPEHCLGLMKQVKAYERLTIQAAMEQSLEKAITALTLHPLIRDYQVARQIVDGYIKRHGAYFPELR